MALNSGSFISYILKNLLSCLRLVLVLIVYLDQLNGKE